MALRTLISTKQSDPRTILEELRTLTTQDLFQTSLVEDLYLILEKFKPSKKASEENKIIRLTFALLSEFDKSTSLSEASATNILSKLWNTARDTSPDHRHVILASLKMYAEIVSRHKSSKGNVLFSSCVFTFFSH